MLPQQNVVKNCPQIAISIVNFTAAFGVTSTLTSATKNQSLQLKYHLLAHVLCHNLGETVNQRLDVNLYLIGLLMTSRKTV